MKGYAPGWQVRCVKCGHVRDAGEAGHVRIGGWSWKRYIMDRCPKCRWFWFQAFERKPAPPTMAGPHAYMAGSTRLWIWWIVHWAARVIAIALALLVVVLLIGEGGPNPFKSSLLENLQHLAFIVLVPLALVAGWRWPLAAGLVGAAALLAFYVMNFVASGRWPGGAFPLFTIPPALFLLDWLLQRSRKLRSP